MACPKPLWNSGKLLTHVHKKNVVYIAYVGRLDGKYTFKYGKSSDVYQREMGSHRHNFDKFDMLYVHKTNMKDQVESLFEQELIAQRLHTTKMINNRKQTELFRLRRKMDVVDINDMLCDIIRSVDDESAGLKDLIELERIRLQRMQLEVQSKILDYDITRMLHNISCNSKNI